MLIDPVALGVEQGHLDWMAKERCEHDLLFFTRFMFKEHYKKQFKVNRHHIEIVKAFKDVESGLIPNLCLNLPPRYTKTQLMKMWIAQTFARNPMAGWVHTTYSDDLALDNSADILELIESPTFQKFWPVEIDKRNSAKKLWRTTAGGGMRAGSSGSAMTGFGAGVLGWKHGDLFAGAVVSDDPLKPDDAYSRIKRDRINRRIGETMQTRRNSDFVPMVVIMQRLHDNDPTGFLLKGGTDLTYKSMAIRALDESGNALWPEMHSAERLKAMQEKNRYLFASQYQQEPTPLEGGLVNLKWFMRFDAPPAQPDMIVHSWDTAYKGSEHNDPSVGGVWFVKNGEAYLVDLVRKRMEYPELKRAVLSLADKYTPHVVLIEDKASGQSLIQDLRKSDKLPMIPVMPKTDKLTRFSVVTALIESGLVHLPNRSPWLLEFENELTRFPAADNDDQVDMVSQFLGWLRENQHRKTNAPRVTQL